MLEVRVDLWEEQWDLDVEGRTTLYMHNKTLIICSKPCRRQTLLGENVGTLGRQVRSGCVLSPLLTANLDAFV